jgi:predicted nucleic acid-binding protein
MKYILDSNIALKWVLAEPDSGLARQLRADYQQAVHDLLAPDVFPIEIAHALTRAERQARIATSQAAFLWADIMSTTPLLILSSPLIPRAIQISSSERAGVYDCLYVALAEREGCDLLTADEKLIKKLQPNFPFIKPLSSLPAPPPPSAP